MFRGVFGIDSDMPKLYLFHGFWRNILTMFCGTLVGKQWSSLYTESIINKLQTSRLDNRQTRPQGWERTPHDEYDGNVGDFGLKYLEARHQDGWQTYRQAYVNWTWAVVFISFMTEAVTGTRRYTSLWLHAVTYQNGSVVTALEASSISRSLLLSTWWCGLCLIVTLPASFPVTDFRPENHIFWFQSESSALRRGQFPRLKQPSWSAALNLCCLLYSRSGTGKSLYSTYEI